MSIGPATADFVGPDVLSFVRRDDSDVLNVNTLAAGGATVNVLGGVSVQLLIDLQAPAPGNAETFEVRLYDKDVFGPATADMPWLILGVTPILTADLVVTADSPGGVMFTVLLTGDDQVRTSTYDVAIVTKRAPGGLLDTLLNLADNVNINLPLAELGSIDMGTLLEGNAIDNTLVEPAAIINALDASLLAAAINSQTFDALVDFNRDGLVDPVGGGPDLALLIGSYLRFSPVIVVAVIVRRREPPLVTEDGKKPILDWTNRPLGG